MRQIKPSHRVHSKEIRQDKIEKIKIRVSFRTLTSGILRLRGADKGRTRVSL